MALDCEVYHAVSNAGTVWNASIVNRRNSRTSYSEVLRNMNEGYSWHASRWGSVSRRQRTCRWGRRRLGPPGAHDAGGVEVFQVWISAHWEGRHRSTVDASVISHMNCTQFSFVICQVPRTRPGNTPVQYDSPMRCTVMHA